MIRRILVGVGINCMENSTGHKRDLGERIETNVITRWKEAHTMN
jgi:hypothetical protein